MRHGRGVRFAILGVVLAAAMPGGACADEAEPGLSHRFEYTGEIFADVHGGMRRGTARTGLAHVSLEWAGASWAAHSDIYAPHGDSLSQGTVGDFSVLSNIVAVHQVRVHELWAQRAFGPASLRMGLLSADTEFWGSETANLFISSAFGAPSVVSGNLPHPPIYPQGVLGVRAEFDLGKTGALRFAVLDGDGGDLASENRHGLHISLGQGALLLAEYQPIFNPGGDHQTSLRFSSYYHTGSFVDARGNPVRGNRGFIGVLDHTVNARLQVFARVGVSQSDRSTVPWSVETGFDLTPVFGEGDKLGVAVAFVDLNSHREVTATALPLRHEIILESTLDWPLNKWLDLQPDVQYIIDPGGTAFAHNAVVIGLRVSLHNLEHTGILR